MRRMWIILLLICTIYTIYLLLLIWLYCIMHRGLHIFCCDHNEWLSSLGYWIAINRGLITSATTPRCVSGSKDKYISLMPHPCVVSDPLSAATVKLKGIIYRPLLSLSPHDASHCKSIVSSAVLSVKRNSVHYNVNYEILSHVLCGHRLAGPQSFKPACT